MTARPLMSRVRRGGLILGAALLILLAGCSAAPTAAPVQVEWHEATISCENGGEELFYLADAGLQLEAAPAIVHVQLEFAAASGGSYWASLSTPRVDYDDTDGLYLRTGCTDYWDPNAADLLVASRILLGVTQ